MRTINAAIVLAVVLAGAGCRSSLEVKVERVLGVSSTALRPDSRLGVALQDAINHLSEYERISARVQTNSETGASALASNPGDASMATDSESSRAISALGKHFETTGSSARELREKCERYLGSTDITADVAAAIATVNEASSFLRDAASKARAAETKRAVDALQTRAPDSAREVSAALAALEESSIARVSPYVGFGGFASTDIYCINPSDPKYQEALNDRDPFTGFVRMLGFSNVSYEKLSEAQVDVAGDSSVMLVMEQPGQVRVYQVSNDPTQLARNVAGIVSKAASAVAKYTTGRP